MLKKVIVIFLVGGGLLSKEWQPIALAAAIVATVWMQARIRELLEIRKA